MSYTVANTLDLGPVYTGVTLNAQLYDTSNSTVGSAITTGFYERTGAQGLYAFTLTVPDSHQGYCDVYVSGASSLVLATIPINPAEVELAAFKALIVAALATDTYAEVSAVPAATSTLKDKINWLFALARNKYTETDSTGTIYADNGTTSISTNAISDDGTTLSRNKWS
jgi:hypothetical protein